MAGILSALCIAIFCVAKFTPTEHIRPPAAVHATNVFAGQPKRAIPVIDLRAKSDSDKITCPTPNDVIAPTLWDPSDRVTKKDCDWYYKTFVKKK